MRPIGRGSAITVTIYGTQWVELTSILKTLEMVSKSKFQDNDVAKQTKNYINNIDVSRG